MRPADCRLTALTRDPRGQLVNQPGVLGNRNKPLRRDLAQRSMSPLRCDLEFDHIAAVQVDSRLKLGGKGAIA